MSRMVATPMLAALCVLGTACFSPDGTPRTTGASGGSTDAMASSTTEPDVVTTSPTTAGVGTVAETEAPGCEACVVATPEGWTGPVVVSSAEELPDCAGAFAGSRTEVLTDLAAGDPTCSCSCGEPTVDCSELGLIYRQDCGGVTGVDNFVGAEVCHDNTAQQNTSEAIYTPLAGTEACEPEVDNDIPTPTSTEMVMCGGTFSQGDCGAGELCVPGAPAGFDSRLCVSKAGDNTCPPAYPERVDVFGAADDSRACSDCECEPQGTFDCTTTLHVHDDDTCGTPREDVGIAECVASWGSFTFDAPTVSGVCTASETAPTGAYEGVDPITVCCDA